jgi:GNAT superfamily N-acetyltransferase
MTSDAAPTAAEELFGRPPADLPALDPAPPSRRHDPNLEIRILDFTSKRDRKLFMDVGDGFYEGDPNYIAPLRIQQDKFLDPSKNPTYEHIEARPMIAYRDGKPVGRMSVQIDRDFEVYNDKKTGLFGFFESIDDPTVAHTMLDDGLRWLKRRGCVEVLGPANFNLTHPCGLVVKNFDRPPFVEELYNHPYYQALIESFGLAKAKDLYAWWLNIDEGMNHPKRERIERISQRIVKKEGVTFREVDMKNLKKEIQVVHHLFTQAWEKNWGFNPIPAKEFEWICEDIAAVAIPELIVFMQIDGRDVGFVLTMPNINENLPRNGKLFPFGWLKMLRVKKTKHARLYLLGILKEYRRRGLESVLMSETVKRCNALGINSGEIGWTLEDNHLINKSIEAMNGNIDRIYRIYGMRLD